MKNSGKGSDEKSNEKENLNKYKKEIITVSDCSAYGGCVSGWKTFCDANKISWRVAVRQGLSVETLLETKDVIAEDIIRYKFTGVKKL
jgi:hypothetical protein